MIAFMQETAPVSPWVMLFAALLPVLSAVVVRKDGTIVVGKRTLDEGNLKAFVAGLGAIAISAAKQIFDPGFEWDMFLFDTILGVITYAGTFAGVWDHTGVNDRLPDFGLGKPESVDGDADAWLAEVLAADSEGAPQ